MVDAEGKGLVVQQEWEPEELISVWTLLEEDMGRLRNKSGANRLGFALLLKFFEVEARFPEGPGEVPDVVVGYVAQQVKVPAEEWGSYDWLGKAIQRHRVEIRSVYGFRPTTEDDQAKLTQWLTAELCPVELWRERLAEAVVARCRNERIEPPAPGQVRRLVASSVKDFETQFCRRTVGRLSQLTRDRLDELVTGDQEDGDGGDHKTASAGGGRAFFAELKAPGGARAGQPVRGDQQAGAGVPARAARGPVHGCVGEAGGVLAGAGLEGVPG